jgi:hypothetical protein
MVGVVGIINDGCSYQWRGRGHWWGDQLDSGGGRIDLDRKVVLRLEWIGQVRNGKAWTVEDGVEVILKSAEQIQEMGIGQSVGAVCGIEEIIHRWADL